MGTQIRTTLSRTLLRGESLVASAGLAAAGIMVLSLGASALWSLHTARDHLRIARRDQVAAVAQGLARGAEAMLHMDEISALRTLVAGTAANYSLTQIRINLPDNAGTVLAESGPPHAPKGTSSPYPELPSPEVWARLHNPLTEPRITAADGGALEVQIPLNVPERGPAILTIRDDKPFPLFADWEGQFGAAGIGAVSLGGMLLAYRAARSRLRALGAVRESLEAAEGGEQSAQALMISPTLGREAVAWNRLLAELEHLRERAAQDKTGERMGAGRGPEGELSNVCDALWQGLLLVDEKLRIKYVNGAGAILLRARREEVVGSESAKHLDANVLSALKSVVAGEARTRLAVEIERRADDNASRIASVLRFSVRPIRREGSTAALVFVEDITQQKVADESRNVFVASATHELRTPLTNMRLYIDQMLEDENLDAAKRDQALNVISTEARRLERIVGDMLSVAEIEAGQLKLNRGDVRLEPIFQELLADFEEPARQANIRLRFDLPPKWPTMTGDRDKIVLALHNLVGNAVKYTPAGGEVTVRVKDADGHLSVDVIDTGFGINEEESELIFEKFYRSKDRRVTAITGTGLGLSLAREVVRMHGGDISVHSQFDKGSTFTVTLPLAA